MDIQKKKDKITAIKDEVKDFHPVLEILFRKMHPEISNVNHTHGTNEFGADFVLTKFNNLIGDTEYIGVLVKVGSYTQRNIHDVERQIEETNIKRFALNGTKDIHITEIWVVTNQHFAKNAQEIIHEKYKSKNIKFIDEDTLIKWIDKYTPNYWTDIEFEISDLLEKIRIKNDEIDKGISLISNNIYIDQDIYEIKDEDDYVKIKKSHKKVSRTPIDIYETIKNNKFMIIE